MEEWRMKKIFGCRRVHDCKVHPFQLSLRPIVPNLCYFITFELSFDGLVG